MAEHCDDHETMASVLRTEFRSWHPRRGPDLVEVSRRADRSWQRPIVLLSSAGAAALALILLAALMLVAVAPPVPAAAVIRDHLLAH